MIARGDTEAGEEVPENGEEEGIPLEGCSKDAVESNEWGNADQSTV